MAEQRLGIIMNGVTGRMGMNQHLARSVMAIRKEGGVRLVDGTRVIPDPILVGRNAEKLKKLAAEHGVERWTTDLDEALRNPDDAVFFDAASTRLRPVVLKKALAAKKHIYCEKPVATSLAQALDLYRAAKKAGVRHGVVQDKLWLPGLLKIKALRDAGFFGKILSVRGEFGYWVFEGDEQPAQRPSWNYRKKDGGGIILDMLCHWRYVLDNLFGEVKSVSCLGGVRRDDLAIFQVDGTKGSAVAGLTRCFTQSLAETPRPVWNPDVRQTHDFGADWKEAPADKPYDNAFKAEWELFIHHVCEGAPFRWNLLEGAKGLQLVDCALKSWRSRRWVDVPRLKA